MNDDFSNRELSIEELEAIAAGSFLHDVWNAVTHPTVLLHDIVVAWNWLSHASSGNPWTPPTSGMRAK
jgi:hypothetical protein